MASRCPDPKFAATLIGLSRVPKNWSIQLKIIAAVKEDYGEHDMAALSQLSTCSQGLCDAVAKAARAAEATALRSRQ